MEQHKLIDIQAVSKRYLVKQAKKINASTKNQSSNQIQQTKHLHYFYAINQLSTYINQRG